ncbi:hypothetical protein ACIQBJ_05895 [Kitasatospora sp. NPDC088391]|uniref:hypothetical protein n=1 Tax=Kitasatospora sp. NPDC088391 TaxID=3364074 RepID=UPI003811208B
MMFDEVAAPKATWWGIVKERAAACWWQLIVLVLVELLLGAVATVLVYAVAPHDYRVVGVADLLLSLVVTAALAGAKARVLGLGVGPLTALRLPPLRIALMAVLSLLLSAMLLHRLGTLLADGPFLADLPVAGRWGMGALVVVLAVLALPLPMAVFLEGRGLGRACRIAFGDWRTALRLLGLALLQFALGAFVPMLAFNTLYRYGAGVPSIASSLVPPVLGYFLLFPVFASYLRSPAARPPAPPVEPDPYPQVGPAFTG